jgi:peptidyl-prolyl cis-trans isomerase C
MPKKPAPRRARRRQPSITSITYWRKFATHRIIYIGLAGIIGFGIIAYFGSSPYGGSPGAAREEYMADAIATVNGETVTRREFEKQAEQARRRSAPTPAMAAAEEGYILSGLIDAALLRAAAKSRHLEVSDADVNKAIEDIRKVQQGSQKSKLSDEDLLALMGVDSMNELREALRRDLLPRRLGENLAQADKLSFEDLAKSYDEIKVRHILIAVSSGSSPVPRGLPDAQARRKAEQVLAELRAGGDFAALANKYTDDPSNQPTKWDPKAGKSLPSGAPKGGSLGWYKRGGGFDKDFEQAAFALKPGEISDIVKTQFGYHIIKVDETRRNLPKDYEKNKVQLLEDLKSRKISEAISDFLSKERTKAKIVWKDPSLEWRYAYAKSSPMASFGMQPEGRDKAEADLIKHLRAYVPKHKTDSAAALILGQMLYRQYIVAGLPPGIAGPKPPKVDRQKLLAEVMECYELALQHVEDQDTRMTLARLYRENKQPEKALTHYRQMHKMLSWDSKPEQLPIREQLEKALRELGDTALADKEAAKIAELKAKEAEERRAAAERAAREKAQKKASTSSSVSEQAKPPTSATTGTIKVPVGGPAAKQGDKSND